MQKMVCLIVLLSLLLVLAGCAPNEYDVIIRINNLSVDASQIAVSGIAFEAVLEAHELYKLPEMIEVIVDGDTLDPDDYSYDASSGRLEIPGEAITGEVKIQAEAQRLGYDVLTDVASGISIQGEAWAYPQQAYKAVLVADAYYLLPESVAVSIGGAALAEGDYIYDPATGELVVTADITGEIRISGEPRPIVYQMTVSSLGVTVSGDEGNTPGEVAPAFGYETTLISSEGYTLPDTVEVLVEGTVLDPSAYTYDAVTGDLVIPGASITGNLQIHAVGIPQIVGDWTTTVDITAFLNDYLSSYDPGMATYFEFSDITFDASVHFNADLTGSVEVDQDSVNALFQTVKDQMVVGVKVMLRELLAAQGLDMDVDFYLTLFGIDIGGLIDQAINFDDLGLTDLDAEGTYWIDGNKLYLINEEFGLDEEDYILFTLNADTLTLESISGDLSGQAAFLLPMTLTCVTE